MGVCVCVCVCLPFSGSIHTSSGGVRNESTALPLPLLLFGFGYFSLCLVGRLAQKCFLVLGCFFGLLEFGHIVSNSLFFSS